MAIQVALTHKTHYRYDRPVELGPQIVRLRPAPHCRTPIISYSLKVTPKKHFLNWQQDPQANYLARLVFPEPTREFLVEVDLVAEMAIINPFDFFLEKSAETIPFAYEPALVRDLRPYLETEPVTPLVARFLEGVERGATPTIDFLVALNRKVQEAVGYVIRMEPGIQSCEETLSLRTGSCRDSAWLLVQLLRNLGLAARFVSGYLIQLVVDQKSVTGPDGPDQDFTDLHAWTEVYLPGAGWLGLDPTSGLLAGEGHIPLACSPDAASAAPISGTIGTQCEVEFSHHMEVTRIAQKPRTTKPYTRGQWAAIDQLGHAVDRKLNDGDVRLTMGGEPTFVSVEDMDGAEWNVDAIGPNKRRIAADLVDRLMRRFAPGGVLHFGQGKWYPGESLPRWALNAFWRRDGDAIWVNGEYLAREDKDYGFGPPEARRFMEVLATRLGIDPTLVRGAFEDPWHYIVLERKLPANLDPRNNKLADPEERARLAKVFEAGLHSPVGFVLPIGRRHEGIGPVWLSSIWPLKQDYIFLAPGDGPVGYRLPLMALPWVDEHDYPYVIEQDPFDERPELEPNPFVAAQQAEARLGPGAGPAPAWAPSQAQPQIRARAPGSATLRRQSQGAPAEIRTGVLQHGVSAPWVIRTAVCVEPRKGKLYVFMPPFSRLEDWLDLVALVEETAVELGMPVIIEGYGPPRDPRLNLIAVTPDPGVIEVNVHPAASWDDLSRNTQDLYALARLSRLGSEKFMIDGRHVGTGGGNHIVVGGATAADSPFLRRPDVLRSLVNYWQNHPALSYLFSGLFIGPTSQAPRIDEARNDALYELEIAFKEIARAGANPPPWLIDRALRNILTDVQGNTHRAEFCIDKLYSPDSATGRLGLVELRGFEMPPHAEMSLVQQLLVRAMIAWFWNQPYATRLVRWGTDLHDRFMLPYYVEQDMRGVIEDINYAGFGFDKAWFDPHLNFRFPVHGKVVLKGIELEVRHALEPWHVLGEEGGGGGTVRFVDSSVERLQIKVTGMTGERHMVACNGWKLPLHSTGTEGEYVAGVRFRAWSPPSALHPTIPAHGPLIFDLVDSWSNRSIGGCTYHVAHPGGRNFETLPVNAHEAEGRRLARFEPFGHTSGQFTPNDPGINPDFPLTLDLRRV